ncbi:MAG: hypothetical protein WDM88_04130 [Galbitalea sp.]
MAIEDALWLPSESQLRTLLRSAFAGLEPVPTGFRVVAVISDERREFVAETAEDAYARALLELVDAAAGSIDDDLSL